ncbi:cytochrome P450 [Crossiella sp. SN42]|uniref:cytochrome P450 family protein n=1 Tax=Crossiella sp. SN42 TaxID=2944808 RepID=UPI00207C6B86|nr:cytochrome P450 [Crossiella sp. SN42]MCO1575572.1 cytochrome P450 [Crossiella sp. SN42]
MINGTKAWIISRAHDAHTALHDRRLRKDHQRLTAILQPQLAEAGESTNLSRMFGEHMLFAEDAQHRRMRSFVSRVFSARQMRALAPRIRRHCHYLLDQMASVDSVDLVSSFSFRLPVTVICELLGIDSSDFTSFRSWTNALMEDRQEINVAASEEMEEYFVELIRRKRSNPGNDLLSDLATGRGDLDHLTDRELVDSLFLLFVAGHETTANLIGNAVVALQGDPRSWQRLASDPSFVERVVEEVARYDGAVRMATHRYTAESVVYSDVTIPAGELVLIHLLSANRDEQMHTAADRLNLDSPSGQSHLAFGSGPHYCLGAGLARLETSIALEELSARFPKLRLGCPQSLLQRQHSAIMHGYREIPVVLNAD